MQAIVFKHAGDPQEVLALQNVPRPTPGPSEILIRVEASPIYPSDFMFIQGNYRFKPNYPQIAGLEAVGTVVALGDSVDPALGLKVGQHVVFRHPGAWAEEAAVPQGSVYPVPNGLAWAEASMVFLNPLTAWGLLQESGVDAGEAVLSTAGASSVGRWLAAFARTRGIRLIAVTRSSASAGQAVEAGAEKAFAETEVDPARISELTGGGVAASFDAVGGKQGQLALESLRAGGTLLIYGRMSGDTYPLHNSLFMYRNLTIRGFGVNAFLAKTPRAQIQQVLEEAAGYIKAGGAVLVPPSQYRLQDYPAALESESAGKMFSMEEEF